MHSWVSVFCAKLIASFKFHQLTFSFLVLCLGCAKLVSFVPDKSTTANDMIKISHTVDCGNGHFFCWECRSVQGHAPVACTLWEKWLEKCAKMDNMGAGKKGRI